MTDFDKSMAFVLQWEGGYVNDTQDPGGETITLESVVVEVLR